MTRVVDPCSSPSVSFVPVLLLALAVFMVHPAGADSTGACCFVDRCLVLSPADCFDQLGYYLGDGTTCSPNPCPDCLQPCSGVCCLPDGSCHIVYQGACDQHEGTFVGGWSCDPSPCQASSAPDPRETPQNWGRIKSIYR